MAHGTRQPLCAPSYPRMFSKHVCPISIWRESRPQGRQVWLSPSLCPPATEQHPGAPPQGPTTAEPRDARPGQASSCPQGDRSLRQTGEDPRPHFSIPLTPSIHDFSLLGLGTRSPLKPRGCLLPSSGPLCVMTVPRAPASGH